ncbi:MAG: EamA family transporter [Acidobacteria bacterium]|nr:EamA family transporter [Acidobacteriota bacterium]
MLCEVSVTIAGARLAKSYDPVVTMGLLKTAGFIAGCAVYFGVWDEVAWAQVSPRAWISIVYLGAGASVFGYSVWYWLLRTAPVQKLALSLFLQPIAGTAAGVFIAGETIGPNTLLGAALIFAGLAWQEVRRPPRQPIGGGPV